MGVPFLPVDDFITSNNLQLRYKMRPSMPIYRCISLPVMGY